MKSKLLVLGNAFIISIKTKSKISIIVSLLSFVAAFLPVILANNLSKMTNYLQEIMAGNNEILFSVFTQVIILAILLLLQLIFNYFQNYTKLTDALSTQKYIKKTILQHKCRVKYKYIDNYDSFQTKISFIDTYAGYQVAECMQSIIRLLQKLLIFISIIISLNKINYFIVIILLVTSIPAVILSYSQQDETFIHRTKWTEEGNLALHYFFICSGEEAIQEIRHYGLYDYLKFRWKTLSIDCCEKKNKITIKHIKYNGVADVLRNLVYIGVLLITANEIYKNPSLGMGAFMLVYSLSRSLQDVTGELFVGVASIWINISYMEEFFQLRKLEHENFKSNEKPLKNPDIKVHNVSFTYPNESNPALKDINVTIKHGEKIAIVGENGSGKSTFINLLCGMYKVDTGKIEVSGINLNENISKVRKSISVVFQDFGHYETTIRKNITISDNNRVASDQEILELAKLTNSYDVIEKQQGGLDEEVGINSENGNNLSGGQWQKIAILRAAYRNDADIMILDEPTAALDPLAEAHLYKDFSKLTANKTAVFISHRLGITSVVNRILVFKDGRIIEDGSHKELLARNGEYAKMYIAQAQWYQ